MLCSLPPAVPSQFESLSWRPANGGRWSEHGQDNSTRLSLLSPSVPCPHLLFFFFPLFVCMCVCLCVCACFLQVWKSQHQTSTSQSLWAGERRSCQDVQHQKVSTMSLLIYSYPHIKKNKTTTKKTYWNLMAFLKWLLLIMADISGQPRSTNDFEREKALMWRKVMVDFRSQHRTNFITCKVSKSYDLRHICPYTVLNWYF